MTTIITPASNNNNNGTGTVLISLFVLIVLGIIFFYYGLPALGRIGTPQINVPNKIDVNVKQTP
jgi:hypothetical protein